MVGEIEGPTRSSHSKQEEVQTKGQGRHNLDWILFVVEMVGLETAVVAAAVVEKDLGHCMDPW
jgi:hypothetical protein